MALTIDGSDPSGDLGDLLDDKLDVATAVSDYLPIAGGKVLQVVRATDTTDRTTTNTSYVDASISVTITPQKSTSAILLIWTAAATNSANINLLTTITDSANVSISGAENTRLGSVSSLNNQIIAIAYATPGTTSATTYKGRFRVDAGSGTLRNSSDYTGQLYAIEVSA